MALVLNAANASALDFESYAFQAVFLSLSVSVGQIGHFRYV